MHFPIIKLESIDTPVENFDIDLNFEDPCLLEHTDYFGELYDEEERKSVIESNWLKDLFDGYATIDTENDTITFLDADTIRNTFKGYLVWLTHNLYQDAENGRLSGYQFRASAEEYKGCSALFYLGYGQTSFQFLEDAVYYAGKTFRFGNIFDAHF